jgi:putative intracellular protease/amidase/ribosomal protein S18 acetylase RimI-like enzyme
VRADRGLTVMPTDTPASQPDPDVIVIPGSENPLPVMQDEILVEWLRSAAPACAWTASVCTGAGLYAAAGLLHGKTTTTHWAFRDNLRALGVDVVGDRVVWQGTHVSGAGVSAGIDMALALTERVHGRKLAEALQLTIEYDPQPPYGSGSPEQADATTLRLTLRVLLGDRPLQTAARLNGHARRPAATSRTAPPVPTYSHMLTDHRLRPATPADEPFLTRMLGHATNWREGIRNPVELRYVEGYGRPGDLGVVAEVAGEPAGAAWCRLLTGPDRGYGYVADDVPELAIAVAPEHRGRGLATALIEALQAAVAEAGHRAISLSAEPDNPSRRIYERAGFVRCGTAGGSWTMIADP